jgi:hypothetical protein
MIIINVCENPSSPLSTYYTCSKNRGISKVTKAVDRSDARPFTCDNPRFKAALGNIYMHLKLWREGCGEGAPVEKDYY